MSPESADAARWAVQLERVLHDKLGARSLELTQSQLGLRMFRCNTIDATVSVTLTADEAAVLCRALGEVS